MESLTLRNITPDQLKELVGAALGYYLADCQIIESSGEELVVQADGGAGKTVKLWLTGKGEMRGKDAFWESVPINVLDAAEVMRRLE